MPSNPMPLRIAMVLFRDLTQLDLTGPYEIMARMPDVEIRLVAGSRDPVRTERGLILTPDATFDEYPDPHILFVPGGPGQLPAMEDTALIGYLRRAGATARLVTSVCSGSLLLGAAGLLKGRRATSHWQALDLLAYFGAIPVSERVVEDGNVITGRACRRASTSGCGWPTACSARRWHRKSSFRPNTIPSRPTIAAPRTRPRRRWWKPCATARRRCARSGSPRRSGSAPR